MFFMKKIISFNLSLVLFLLCGCTQQENKQTKFLFDTIVTLTAACDTKTLDGAFKLCEDFEQMLSRTVEGSDVQTLNNSNGFVSVDEHTKKIVERAIYYGDLSGGRFDITIYPVSSLWDFNNQIIPSKDEIAEALKNVDYEDIEIKNNTINLNGKQIDLGGIAKGYIADRVLEYFKTNNVSQGIIDLGGNLVVFGDKNYTIAIKKPFSNNEYAATLSVKNKTVVTSGVYERYIKKDNKIHHHILDPKTGYAYKSDLYSATIIADSSFDADALSTVCLLLGLEGAKNLIENTNNAEAVFIDNKQNLHYTSGLTLKDGNLTLK